MKKTIKLTKKKGFIISILTALLFTLVGGVGAYAFILSIRPLNDAPVIEFSAFDVEKYGEVTEEILKQEFIRAYDKEDGDITDKVKVTFPQNSTYISYGVEYLDTSSDTADWSLPIEVSVTDSDGNETIVKTYFTITG